MNTLFISHVSEDAGYVETLRQSLEAQGYACWHNSAFPTPTEYHYPYAIGRAIIASPVLVVIWSTHTTHDAWVTRHIQIAEQLKKKVLLVALDQTALPPLLTTPILIPGTPPHEETLTQLRSHLPGPKSQETLLVFAEKAGHEYHSSRYTAIDLASDMLVRNEHREEVLAVLQYLAQHDLMTGVREKAQAVLNIDQQAAAMPSLPPPLLNPQDRQYMLGVRCGTCHHVTYFDRRRLCAEKRSTFQRSGSGKNTDDMDVPCRSCGRLMLISVDCEGL